MEYLHYHVGLEGMAYPNLTIKLASGAPQQIAPLQHMNLKEQVSNGSQ